MMFMEEWQIGDEFVKEDGTKVKLEKKRTIHRRARHFTLQQQKPTLQTECSLVTITQSQWQAKPLNL